MHVEPFLLPVLQGGLVEVLYRVCFSGDVELRHGGVEAREEVVPCAEGVYRHAVKEWICEMIYRSWGLQILVYDIYSM